MLRRVDSQALRCESLVGRWPRANAILFAGNSFESCLVAVAVPNTTKLLEWASGAGLQTDDVEVLCREAGAKQMVLSELQAQGKESKLRGFEMVKAVHLHPEEFSIENDLITPTFKLRRPQLLEFFKAQVDAMYSGLKRA